jgi:hypothetical protein
MNCPGSETIAAHADGRLEASEAEVLLEHCAECDGCRRELALLSQPLAPKSVPSALRNRAVKAISIALELERDRAPLRPRVLPREPRTGLGVAAAAAILLTVAAMIALVQSRGSEAPEKPRVVRQTPPPLPEPEPPRPEPSLRPPAPPIIPAEAPRRAEAAEPPRPADLKVEEKPGPAPGAPPDPAVPPPPPKFEETRPEEPPARPSHTILARVLSEVQITDVTGLVTVKRKGAKEKEKETPVGSVVRLAEGDVLTSAKGASFQVEGRHPVVLGDNTSISVAFSAQEQAPWLQIRTGEAMVDSTGPTHWIVSDGRIALVIKQARARFSTSPGDDRLRVAALSEPIVVHPDGGQAYAIRAGEELQVGRASAELHPLDPAALARKIAAFDSARPRMRTIFYTSCDPVDANRGHFFLQEGTWFRNEALLSREQKDKTVAAAIAPNPRFTWREGLLLRFRYMTNARSMEVGLRVEERRYTLFRNLAVERKSVNQWIPVEVPIGFGGLGFRRDDGQLQLTVTTQDHFDAIRFTARQQDAYEAQKAYILVDDIQVVEREKD